MSTALGHRCANKAFRNFLPGLGLILIDRDGTLSYENPLGRASEYVELIPGSATAIEYLKRAGYYLVSVSNQARIGRGEITEDRLMAVNAHLNSQIMHQGGGWGLDYFLYCPHEDGCPWRKPEPGMLLFACQQLGIAPKATTIVGDSHKDIWAGQAVGARTIQVLTRNLVSDGTPKPCQPNHTAPDLLAAAHLILRLDGLET